MDSLLNYRTVRRTVLPIGSLSASLLEFVSNPHLKKITGYPKGYPVILVEEGGFEPPKSLTADLQSAPFGRSGTLPYYGAGERTLLSTIERSTGPFSQSQHLALLLEFVSRPFGRISRYRYGAGERTRTPDLLITNQLLYQLSYTSVSLTP